RVAVRSALPDPTDVPEETRMLRATAETSTSFYKPGRRVRLKRLFQFDPRGDAMRESHTITQNKLEASQSNDAAKPRSEAQSQLREPLQGLPKEPEDIVFMRSQLAEYEPAGKDAVF